MVDSANPETIFQRIFREMGDWQDKGRDGPPPAYPIFWSRNQRIMALIDRFPKFEHQVVVFPVEGTPGMRFDVHDLSPSRRLQLSLVSQAVGRKLLGAHPEMRAIQHVEGYAVDDHPHELLYPAARGAGPRLWQPSEEAERDVLIAAQERLMFNGRETRWLEKRLAVVKLVSPFLDIEGPFAPPRQCEHPR